MFSATTAEQEETWAQQWKDICDKIAKTGPVGSFLPGRLLRHITVNAPVILAFVTANTIIHVLTAWFPHVSYFRDYWHLRCNMTHLLLTGPGVEYAFGSKNIVIIMLLVAVSSALIHALVGSSYTHQLGASGVVFACILLNSLVSASNGMIPLSFILTAVMYLGEEMAKFVLNTDGVSHHAHLTGGLVGAAAGFYIHELRRKKKAQSFVNRWLKNNKTKKK